MVLVDAVPPGRAGVFDLARVQADFPALRQEVNGKQLVYLDSAASTLKPYAVTSAVCSFCQRDYANIHRGLYALSQRATLMYEQARTTIASHLAARQPEEIVFVRGATEAINLVAHSYLRPLLGAGDEVIVSAMEHHSNIVPWQIVCAERGANLKVVDVSERGELLLDELEALMSSRTRLIAITHVSNVLGTVNPVREIVTLAHRHDVPVLVDGAQAVPHLAVDVGELDCDFYVFSGHKAYGPSGIGALYAKYDLLAAMQPYQGGGDMIRSVSFAHTEYADPPHRFEAGTPNIEGAIGLAAALQYLDQLSMHAVAAHERGLLRAASAALEQNKHVSIVGTPSLRSGCISFVVDGVHPHDVATVLDTQGIAVRAGHHCAQPLMQRYELAATVRASFGVYNSVQDVEALMRGLDTVVETFH